MRVIIRPSQGTTPTSFKTYVCSFDGRIGDVGQPRWILTDIHQKSRFSQDSVQTNGTLTIIQLESCVGSICQRRVTNLIRRISNIQHSSSLTNGYRWAYGTHTKRHWLCPRAIGDYRVSDTSPRITAVYDNAAYTTWRRVGGLKYGMRIGWHRDHPVGYDMTHETLRHRRPPGPFTGWRHWWDRLMTSKEWSVGGSIRRSRRPSFNWKARTAIYAYVFSPPFYLTRCRLRQQLIDHEPLEDGIELLSESVS